MKIIRKLAGCVREYWLWTILAPVLMIGEVAMEVTIPKLIAGFVDHGIGGDDMAFVLRQGGLLVLCACASLCFGAGSCVIGNYASTGFAKNLRHDLFHKVQGFSFANIDKFSTSSIVTRMTTDIQNLQNAFNMMTRMVVRCVFTIVLAVCMAMTISPQLCLVYCVVMPLLLFVLLFVASHVHPIFERVFRTYDRLNNVVQENVRGVRVVKSFVREEEEVKKFNGVSERIYKDFVKAERILAINNPVMQFCSYTCIIVISWMGAHLIIQSGNNDALGLTTGELLSMFTYSTQILSALMMVSMVFVMVVMATAAAKRSVEILDEKIDLVSPAEPVTTVPDGSIDFDNVSFRYSETAPRDSLENVDLHIPSGATVGILGVTGAGKSSLVQLIARLYDATQGTVRVGGVDVKDYDLTVLRDNVAMVLQKNVLFSGTIADNLRWGDPNATDEELRHACRLACADEFIQAFPEGYNTYIEQGGSNVSGGQRQRLCIARALLKKPKILILDDSTSAVDTHTDAMIRQAFASEIPDTTKLIIAQRVASVENADTIVIIENGTILAQGTHDELLKTSEAYQEIYNSQKKGSED
ncbi:MAG: ABC transporter ATP-binding protein/permease [Firmicutes bacterium]|nr:ABC transporter ATP-binding protein/permease [Bacillota bacterium]